MAAGRGVVQAEERVLPYPFLIVICRRAPGIHRLGLLLAALSLLVLAACDSDERFEPGDGGDLDETSMATEPEDPGDDPAEEEGPEVEPPEGGPEVLVAALSGEPDRLDPHQTTAYPSFQVLENVYDTLVEPDENLEFSPALAEAWKVSEDGLVWTFTLRDDVTWHDGRALTAADVVYSYDRIVEQALPNAFRLDAVEEVRAVDDLTVEIEVREPTPNLLASIGGFKGVAIVQDGAFGPTDGEPPAPDETADPVGTGPFSFAAYEEGVSLDLEANPEYWGGEVTIAGVEFRFLSEGAVRLSRLQAGEVDWIDSVPPEDVERVLASDEVASGSVASNDYYYLALNHDREPFDDPAVRRALAMGFDREAIVQAAAFGNATANQTAIPEASFWYHDLAPYSYEPEEAADRLADAGIEDLTIDLMVTSDFEETVQSAQIIEAQWSDFGVEVDVRVEDFATWLDHQGEGEFDALILSWLGNIDPDDFYYAQHHSEGVNNFHGYANEEVDELLDRARLELDEVERKRLYDEAAERIVEDASYLYLYNPDTVQAWHTDVSGYVVRPDAAVRFEDVSIGG